MLAVRFPCRVFIVKKHRLFFFLSFASDAVFHAPIFDDSLTQFLIIHHVDQRKPLYITRSIWLKWREMRKKSKITQRQSRLLEPAAQVNEIYPSKKSCTRFAVCCQFTEVELTDLNEHLTSIVTPYQTNHRMRCNRHTHHIVRSMMVFNVFAWSFLSPFVLFCVTLMFCTNQSEQTKNCFRQCVFGWHKRNA